MRPALLVLPWLLGCAKSGALDSPVEDAPEWTDPAGKQSLRLELGASMVLLQALLGTTRLQVQAVQLCVHEGECTDLQDK